MKAPSRIRFQAARLWLPVFVFFLWTGFMFFYARVFNSPYFARMPARMVYWLQLADHLGMLVMYFAVSGISYAMHRRGWAWRRMLPVHLALLPLLAVVQAALFAGLGYRLALHFRFTPRPFAATFLTALGSNWPYDLVFYIAVAGGALALFNYRRFREKERLAGDLQSQLAAAQLQSLRMQLQPHFLFNVLNTISSYIYENPDTAVKIVARLSELLRVSLDSQQQSFMPLGQELRIVEKYLEIEQLRFSDRLQARISIPDDLRQAQVPSFLLQPLLENAMRHGISGQIAGGTVEIAARRAGEMLELRVADDGVGCRSDCLQASGIGLRNTRSRLEKLYGREYRFQAGNRNGGGFAVEISIPFRLEPPAPGIPEGEK
jgi:signal transduction histidine kinase